MNNNISNIVKKNLCIGCGGCSTVCPKNIINIKKGLFLNYAKIKEKECVQCGNCLKVCPSNINNIKNIKKEEYLKKMMKGVIFLSWSTNRKIRKNASSGGYITSLISFLLINKTIDGVVMISENKKNSLEYESVLIKNISELEKNISSKYYPTSPCLGLNLIKNESKKNYAFIGKPCDIMLTNKLRKEYPKKFNNIKITISIFCHHTPYRIGTLKIIRKNKIDSDRISKIEYRGNGWPGEFKIISKNDKILYKDSYLNIWNNVLSKSIPTRCKLCDDHFGLGADISVGDAWGEIDKKNLGLSYVIINSDEGLKYHNLCLENDFINSEKLEFKKILNGQKNLFKMQIKSLEFIKIYKMNFKINYLIEFLNKPSLILNLIKFYIGIVKDKIHKFFIRIEYKVLNYSSNK